MEKQGATFKRHTNKHLIWNYLYYIYCLKKKDETDYTGIEYEIINKVNIDNVSWFPSMGEKDSGGQIEETMTKL